MRVRIKINKGKRITIIKASGRINVIDEEE